VPHAVICVMPSALTARSIGSKRLRSWVPFCRLGRSCCLGLVTLEFAWPHGPEGQEGESHQDRDREERKSPTDLRHTAGEIEDPTHQQWPNEPTCVAEHGMHCEGGTPP
jgi:hypothetical protein